MFNGYHEPPGTSYNDLELDRGKKKWPCGNGTNIQSTHVHPQTHQSEIWCSKPPYIGLPNAVNTAPKCNCPSCYQLPENQSYQGDLTWHRSWLSRTYPAPGSQDLVKLQGNHHWENTCLPAEAYGETAGTHYVQETGDKTLFYKPYSGLRHTEIYQPGVISTLKTAKIAKKEDFPKQDENEIDHQARFASSIANPGCDSFRTAVDRRRVEEESGYPNQNEKYLTVESSRQQRALGPYHLHPNRRAMLESFSKTVPSNTNQNRVPSIGHHNIKDNVFHSYIDQSNIGKVGSYNANQAVIKDKHCRSLYQSDVAKELNAGQESVRTGLMNTLSAAPVDYHNVNFNRDFQNTLDKDFQKYISGRNPQYLPRNNISDVIIRNCQNFVLDTRKDYNSNRKGVINPAMGNARAAQPPAKYMEVGLAKSPTYGKLNARDCGVSGRISTDLKLMVNPNGKDSYEAFQKGEENVIHNHFPRSQIESGDSFGPEKIHNSLPLQNPVFKGSRRPEHPYRDFQLPYDYPNGMINFKSDVPVGINQEPMPNFPDIQNGLEAYNRLNNNLSYDGSCQQLEKMHNQIPGENKVQSSLFLGHQDPSNFFGEPRKVRQPEKEDSGKISHLESIRYEELCKNGTSKISPLRLLRKKKFTQQKKEDTVDVPSQDAGTNSKSSTSPLDVRRFWATWAEEEEDNVPQTQMVVLDCHNIDPEQAGLLHFYNSEPIRTIHLDESNLLDVKNSQFEAPCEQDLAAYKTQNFESANGEKSFKTFGEDEKLKDEARKPLDESKYLSGTEMYGLPLIMDSTKEVSVSIPDVKSNVAAEERFESNNNSNNNNNNVSNNINKTQASKEIMKQFDIFKFCEKNSEHGFDDNHASIKHRHFDHVTSCDNGEISTVLKRDELGAESPSENNIRELVANDSERESRTKEFPEEEAKELTACSDSSDDSENGDEAALSELPTSEYRKNKFLDYPGDGFCNNSLSLKTVSRQVLNAEGVDAKKSKSRSEEEEEEEEEEKLGSLALTPKPSETGAGDFEIDEILRKLSDINVQSPDVGGKGLELMSDIPQKLKTEKILDKKERKTKKLSHKSSRTDQLTLQNISLTKPTIKFSIQKSHDLKISLKVLNNKKKYDKHNSDEDDLGYEQVIERGYSSEGAEDNETAERTKKNRRRLITLKLKGLAEESNKIKEDEDQARKCRKFLKKKKIRLDRSPPPKTPVLKIKKNRYTPNGCESEELVNEPCASSDLPKTAEMETLNHGDFQVHETIDSAKIKLTFKRNKNAAERKKTCSEDDDEVVDASNEAEDSAKAADVFVFDGGTDPGENPNDVETLVSPISQDDVLKQDIKGENSVVHSIVDEDEDVKLPKQFSNGEELVEKSSEFEDESPVTAADFSGMASRHDEDIVEDFEKKDLPGSPAVDTFTCDSAVYLDFSENRKPNDCESEIRERQENVDSIRDLTDFQTPVVKNNDEGVNCDGSVDVAGKENIVKSDPEEEIRGEKSRINEAEESHSKCVGDIKMEVESSEKGLNIVAAEECKADDVDMEISFTTELEKLSESCSIELKVEEEAEVTGEKSPANCDEDVFTAPFEEREICGVEDTAADSDRRDREADDIAEVDAKTTWQQLQVAVGEIEIEEEMLPEIQDPLRELSEEKFSSDLMAIDFPGEHSEKEVDLEINMETITAAENHRERTDDGNNSKSDAGSGSAVGEPGEEVENTEKNKEHPENETVSEVNESPPCGIDEQKDFKEEEEEEEAGENLKSAESDRESQVKDFPDATEAVSNVEDTSSVPPDSCNASHYLQATDDNNNNDNSNNNNNNSPWLSQKENIFIERTIVRRCSCEDWIQEQKSNSRKLRYRSNSLNLVIAIPKIDREVERHIKDMVSEEIPVLDIPVSDIPLPPGRAPPENCVNLEEYLRSKFLGNENCVDLESGGDARPSPGVEKGETEISESNFKQEFPSLSDFAAPSNGEEFKETLHLIEESCEQECLGEVITSTDQSNKKLSDEGEGKTDSSGVVPIVESPAMECKSLEETPGGATSDYCGELDVKLPGSCTEYSENVEETTGTQDGEIDLGESSFRAEGLYECEGLTFDESLSIADDMEEEKVSDDDKFRNIMQNCLDNAKKFLSVGNLQLFSCSRDDLLEIDCFEGETGVSKNREDHISKDVLLSSCEKIVGDDLVLVNHQPSDISVDFVPSFCSDPGSNLCPEVLPVDNWPYLEEEVASSPLRNKQEDPDLLSSCLENNLPEENFPGEKWSLLNETDSECLGKGLRNKSRRVSVCVTEGSTFFRTVERTVNQRRRTIEGIGRWKSFHNSNEELAKGDVADRKGKFGVEGLSLKKELAKKNMEHSKRSRDVSGDRTKRKMLPYAISGRYGKSFINAEKLGSERAKFGHKSARNSADFKSSSWQPKVVLFRISKKVIKDLPMLPSRKKEPTSSQETQGEGNKNDGRDDCTRKRETNDLAQSSKAGKSMRNDRDHLVGKAAESEFDGSVDRIREILSQDVVREPRREKILGSTSHGVKRKKNRFRNLHTKKRVVPDAFDLTKEKSATENSSSLVDSEESSPERDIPNIGVFSQCKSTKTKGDELYKETDDSARRSNLRTEEEAMKAKRKYKESERRRSSESGKDSCKNRDNKRKRETCESKHEMESQRKRERNHAGYEEKTGRVEIGVKKYNECAEGEKWKKFDSGNERESKPKKQRYWKCDVCGFSKSSERAIHIQSHPFHCQSCHLAFKAETNFVEHLTRKHKDIRNQHHCLLCELSFDLERDYYRHLETREHKHLESVEKNTINTLFTLLTGHPCPVLGPVESKPEWLPTQAGTVHFYHQATPLSLALQYLKLHRDKTATLPTPIE